MSTFSPRFLLVVVVLLALTTLCCCSSLAGLYFFISIPPSPTPTATTFSQPCAFVWGRQSAPEVEARLREMLEQAGLPVVSTIAMLDGEKCVNPDGSIDRFAIKQTDVEIVLQVENLNDPETAGALLTQTLEVLDAFGPLPGGLAGSISLVFRAGEDEEKLRFERSEADALRAQGLTGAALYRALKGGD